MKRINYDELCSMVNDIENDIQYIVTFKLTHLMRGDEGCWNEYCRQINFSRMSKKTYENSTLCLVYVSNKSEFRNINYDFILDIDSIDNKLIQKMARLNKRVSSIITDKVPLKSIIMGSIIKHMSWGEVWSILRPLEDGIQLSQVIEELTRRESYWEGTFVPKLPGDILVDSTIRVRLLEHVTNEATSTNIGYIRVSVPILSYGRDWSGTLQLVKNAKKDIDQIVLCKIEERLKRTNLSINFFKLSNCTFRRDYILEYTLSLKEI